MIFTIMTVMSLTMMTLSKKFNLCRKSQSNIGSSAITTDEHPGIRRLRKLRLPFHRLYHRLYKLFIPCNHIDSLDTVINKLTPWNAKEVEYVDQAHPDGVQAGMNVFDTHCYNKTCGNKTTLGRAVIATWERLRDPVHRVSDPEEPRGGRPLGWQPGFGEAVYLGLFGFERDQMLVLVVNKLGVDWLR